MQQLAPIVHPPGFGENDVSFTINYLVTDANGDFVEGCCSYQCGRRHADCGSCGVLDPGRLMRTEFIEDATDAGSRATALPGGPDDFVDLNTDGDNDESTATGSVSALFQSGADEPLTYSL